MLISIFFLLFLRLCWSHWIDPQTPDEAQTFISYATPYHLVFSDEFNEDGRSFSDGHDIRWTALQKNDYTNNALQYYAADLVSTSNGYLNITTISEDTSFTAKELSSSTSRRITKHYRSGMVQGWNKFCFTGGVVEIRARLPGRSDVGGLWPAMWMMGNLARATYVSSSDFMWPWSFATCDRSLQPGQEISACNNVNHFGLPPHVGRGAPEIDILEAMAGKLEEKLTVSPVGKPYYSASLQVSPGVSSSRPSTGHPPHRDSNWYSRDMHYGPNSTMNVFFYGVRLEHDKAPQKDYQSDAISANRQLDASHFDSFHNYRLEWNPGDTDGYLRWYLDDELVFAISTETLRLTGTLIPEEPMYLLLNTAISSTWGFPDPCPAHCSCDCYDCKRDSCSCALPSGFCDMLPAHFLIDYVRVYQKQGQAIGCSTASHPTKRFIRAHAERYMGDRDIQPLKDVRRGGAKCLSSSDCGSNGGACVNSMCQCSRGYLGPRCKSPPGFDDEDLDPDGSDSTMLPSHPFGLVVPISLRLFFAVAAAAAVAVVAYRVLYERKRRVAGWRAIDEDDTAHL